MHFVLTTPCFAKNAVTTLLALAEAQAMTRDRRPGQQSPVSSLRLISKDTKASMMHAYLICS
jgi:hypothetical protein